VKIITILLCFVHFTGAKFFDIIAKTKRKSKKTKLKAFVANREQQQTDIEPKKQTSVTNLQLDVSARK